MDKKKVKIDITKEVVVAKPERVENPYCECGLHLGIAFHADKDHRKARNIYSRSFGLEVTDEN